MKYSTGCVCVCTVSVAVTLQGSAGIVIKEYDCNVTVRSVLVIQWVKVCGTALQF